MNMNRKSLLIILALLLATALSAAPVSRQQAMALAQQFLQQKGERLDVGTMRMAYRAPLKKGSERAAYYVFNASNEDGYVIISGDDRARQVLAYTDKGAFDEQNMPEAMKAMLNGYEAELKWISEQLEQNPSYAPKKAVEASKKAISPMLTTTWNQDSPYNDQCPVFIDGNPSVTGCVAAAMAQVMYYHRDNSVGETQATIPGYNCSTTWNGSFRVNVPSVPAGTALHWRDMLDAYNDSETDAQKSAVATLLFACGASLNMDYANAASGGSSASSSLIPQALKTYFGYEAEMSYKSRANYKKIEDWDNLIYNELLNNRPVVYDGQSSGGGHAFVVDGYDGDGLFHVNWGWGGMSDGYFVLSVMNPDNNTGIGASASSDGYSMDQGAVIGVQPTPFEAEAEDETLTAKNISVSGNVITATFQNNTTTVHNVQCGFGIVGEDGQVVLIKDWGNFVGELGPRSYYPNETFNIAASDFQGAGLQPGDYQLVPVCLLDDETAWKPCWVADVEYVDAHYDEDGTVTLEAHSSVVDLTATAFDFPGSLLTGASQPVNITLKNNGDEYSGLIYFFVNGTQTGKTGVALAAGKSSSLQFSFTPSSAGTYTLSLSLSSDGSDPIATTSVTIAQGSAEENLTVSSFTVENADPANDKTVYGTTLKGTAVIRNDASSVYAGDVYVSLLANTEISGTYHGVQSVTVPVVIAAGETATVDVSFVGLNFDLYYMVSFRYGSNHDNRLNNSNFSTYDMEPGLMLWDAAGNLNATAATSGASIPESAVAADLSGTGVSAITPNSNPNTLYYIGTNDQQPTGLNGSNVVKGNKAESIALHDGYDFFVPKSFTADEVSFTMTPTVTTNGKGGWMTLVLPFAATKVTRNDTQQTIDWFHSRTDSDKHFWMKSFAEVDGTTALFGYADQHEANVPYIVAFPGSKWGEEFNLGGKELVFSASNARLTADVRQISSTSVYNFVGTTTAQRDVPGIFFLNEAGTNFALSSSADVQPFRAYFTAKSQQGQALPAKLSIGSAENTSTEILIPVAAEDEVVGVYNLNGVLVRKVGVTGGMIDTSALPKGIYIIKGKKIVI